MKNAIILWTLAVFITLGSAYYQRTTGPTYPLKGTTFLCEEKITYKLNRTHSGNSNDSIFIPVSDPKIFGFLEYKRHKTDDALYSVPLDYKDGKLIAVLPGQPPAGKLEYQIILGKENSSVVIPSSQPCVIRFKGEVPLWVLIPHVITIFLAMLFSTRTGLEIFQKSPKYKRHILLTFAALIPGGFILGPLTQYYAFGALWTGFPFGYDLTDNKTLIALIGWLFAGHMVWRTTKHKFPVLFAAFLMLTIFLIPHSVLGSEIDYRKEDAKKKKLKETTAIFEDKSFAGSFNTVFNALNESFQKQQVVL